MNPRILLGDSSIARHLFGDARKRRIVKRLKQDKWPIFEMDGRNAALPDHLEAEVERRARDARENCKNGTT